MTDFTQSHPPINLPILGKGVSNAERSGGAITFADVEERLIEAWGFLRRTPDREAGWMRARVLWPEIRRHTAFGDYGDMDADAPRRLPGLRAAEVGRRDEALGWVEWVEPRDRKLVGVVLDQLQREARPSWVAARLKLGVTDVTADALSRRYDRAIGRIAAKLARQGAGGAATA